MKLNTIFKTVCEGAYYLYVFCLYDLHPYYGSVIYYLKVTDLWPNDVLLNDNSSVSSSVQTGGFWREQLYYQVVISEDFLQITFYKSLHSDYKAVKTWQLPANILLPMY